MATQTWYFTETALAGTVLGTLQTTSVATGTTYTSGWTVSKTAATNSAAFQRGVLAAATAFSTTAKPVAGSLVTTGNGDAFRTSALQTGFYAAGNWTFSFRTIGSVASGAGRMELRVYRSTDPTGATGLTEITSAVLQAAIATTSTTEAVSTLTWAAPSISLSGEYLFVQAAWLITTAGGTNGMTVKLRSGGTVATTSFTPATTVTNSTTVGATLNPPLITTVHRYVNTDSTGGDGTTPATTGATAAYATLAACLTAEAKDLTATAQAYVVHCDGTTVADTSLPSYSGWTTSKWATLTIQVDAARRHTGVYDTTKYRLEGDPGINALIGAFTTLPYVKIYGLQFTYLGTNGGYIADLQAGSVLAYCLLRAPSPRGTSSDTTAHYYLVQALAGATTSTDPFVRALCYNNIVVTNGNASSTAFAHAVFTNTYHAVAVYNNTFISTGTTGAASGAVYTSVSTPSALLKNNLVSGFGSGVLSGVGSADTGSDYNATTATSTGVGGAHDRVSQTFTFRNAAGGDYRLAMADTGARGFGVDLSSDTALAFTDDIVGTTRTVPWDIGADEAIAVLATSTKTATVGATLHGTVTRAVVAGATLAVSAVTSTKTATVGATLQKTRTLGTTVAATLRKPGLTRSTALGTTLQRTGIARSATASALLSQTHTRSATVATALVKRGVVKAATAAALLSGTHTKTVAVGTTLSRTSVRTTTLAATLLARAVTRSVATGTTLKALGVPRSIAARATLARLGITTSTTAQALLAHTFTRPATLGATLRKTSTRTLTATTLLAKTHTAPVGAGATLRATVTRSIAVGSTLQRTVATGVSARATLAARGVTLPVTLGATLARASVTRTATVRATLALTRGATLTAGATLRKTSTRTLTATTLLAKTHTAPVGAGATLRATVTRSTSVLATLQQRALMKTLAAGATLAGTQASGTVGLGATLAKSGLLVATTVRALLAHTATRSIAVGSTLQRTVATGVTARATLAARRVTPPVTFGATLARAGVTRTATVRATLALTRGATLTAGATLRRTSHTAVMVEALLVRPASEAVTIGATLRRTTSIATMAGAYLLTGRQIRLDVGATLLDYAAHQVRLRAQLVPTTRLVMALTPALRIAGRLTPAYRVTATLIATPPPR